MFVKWSEVCSWFIFNFHIPFSNFHFQHLVSVSPNFTFWNRLTFHCLVSLEWARSAIVPEKFMQSITHQRNFQLWLDITVSPDVKNALNIAVKFINNTKKIHIFNTCDAYNFKNTDLFRMDFNVVKRVYEEQHSIKIHSLNAIDTQWNNKNKNIC